MIEYKWRDRVIHNPSTLQKIGIWTILVPSVLIGLVFAAIGVVLVIISIPFHCIARLCGGRGFVVEERDGLGRRSYTYKVPTWFSLLFIVAILLLIFA